MGEKSDHVALEILSYLTRNPLAQDTLTGIVEWWLGDLDPSARPWDEVEQAVSRLHREGHLAATRGADGQIRFGLAPAHRDSALRRRRALEGQDEGGPWEEPEEPGDLNGEGRNGTA